MHWHEDGEWSAEVDAKTPTTSGDTDWHFRFRGRPITIWKLGVVLWLGFFIGLAFGRMIPCPM